MALRHSSSFGHHGDTNLQFPVPFRDSVRWHQYWVLTSFLQVGKCLESMLSHQLSDVLSAHRFQKFIVT